MDNTSTVNTEGETPEINKEIQTESPVNSSPTEIDALLLEARQRRARVRAKTEEIIHRNSQLARNETMDTKNIIAWGIVLAMVAGLIYYSIIKLL